MFLKAPFEIDMVIRTLQSGSFRPMTTIYIDFVILGILNLYIIMSQPFGTCFPVKDKMLTYQNAKFLHQLDDVKMAL